MNYDIVSRLLLMKDEKYKEFHGKLMPGISEERIIGVRVPEIRKLAGDMIKEGSASEFVKELPHYYYEENNLHAFIIADTEDFDMLIYEIDRFLPFVDNWATCDSLRPEIFGKYKDTLLPHIFRWMNSEDEFTVRFAIEMLMAHYLDDSFDSYYPQAVSEIKSEKYYINMMIAWYFATALAKQWDTVIPFVENRILSPWVHNKTISKARESYRISEKQKEYLKSLRIGKVK